MRFPRSARPVVALAIAVLALTSCMTLFGPDRDARAPTLDGFGSLRMTVTTKTPAAQQAFTQGMLQAYAFNDQEAVRAFKAALAQDPACAMCAWGVAYALGPNINATDRGDLTEARQYAALARRSMAGATPREQALIEAIVARYGESDAAPAASAWPDESTCRSGPTAKAHPLDVVYAAKMRAIVEAYPDDPDVTTLYAEAVMIATRVDWWDRTTGVPAGEIGPMTDRLERALAKAPEHTGLNHFLVHAVDQSPSPSRAEVAADRLGILAPQSPHLLHMPAHIYVRIARFGDAVRVNDKALAAEVRQTAEFEAQGFAPTRNWDGHNIHFLWFAALMDGRGDFAVTQSRRLAQRSANRKTATGEFMRSLPLLTLVRLERWDDVLAEPPASGEAGVAPPLGNYARGVALVRQGKVAEAEAEAAALAIALDAPALKDKTLMGDDPARTVLDVLNLRLQAEIAVAKGQPDAARAALERGAKLEAALDANEPPILGLGSQLALGDLLLRAQRPGDAEAAYRSDLTLQPGSGWALQGLVVALAKQGKNDESARVERELDRAWPVADATLRRTRLQ